MSSPLESNPRFQDLRLIGQGSFSKIYAAFDNQLQRKVAIKQERLEIQNTLADEEYRILREMKAKNLCHVPSVFEILEDSPTEKSFILELLGFDLVKLQLYLQSVGKAMPRKTALKIQIQALDCLREIHEAGFIHRDVKPANFVLSQDQNKLFIVDFGLAHQFRSEAGEHMKDSGATASFKGTISYASLNTHNFRELSRRDDLWSYFFMLLEFLGEQLSWRTAEDISISDVKNLKEAALQDPENLLWPNNPNCQELKNIFKHLSSLEFEHIPDYALIKEQLARLLKKDILREQAKLSQVVAPKPVAPGIGKKRLHG